MRNDPGGECCGGVWLVNLSILSHCIQLREVQEQLAYLTDLQARLIKAGRRKKKKEGLGAGSKGPKKDGEGYVIIINDLRGSCTKILFFFSKIIYFTKTT